VLSKILNRAFIAVFGIAVFAAILFGSLAFDSVLAAKEPKVTICHVDPDGDGAGPETLEVNAHSLAKHLAHGDGLGACFTCGNGLEEAGEECDDGEQNSDTEPDACRTTCELATCGDAVLDTAEQCDDGGANSDSIPDACRTNCQPASCGDNVADSLEECDGTDLRGMDCGDFGNNANNIEGYLDSNLIGYIDGNGQLACFDCMFDTTACFFPPD